MKLGLRKKKLVLTALTGALVMFLICSIIAYFGYNKLHEKELALKDQYELELKELEHVAAQNMQAYALNVDVKRGDHITSDMLTEVFVPDGAFAINSLTPLQLDMEKYYARTDYLANTQLTEALVYKEEMVTDDLRALEYGFIHLPSKLKSADYVDIRIQFPNGEDYIIMAKKKVEDVQGVTLWMNNDEGEILSMSSAMVDAFLHEGKIYATTYVDGTMQESLQMTYPVNEAVRSLIISSPNIVNRAKLHLEKQNRAILESNLSLFDAENAKKVRETESQYDSVKSMEDKERALIEQNSTNGYETELVNPDFAEGTDN